MRRRTPPRGFAKTPRPAGVLAAACAGPQAMICHAPPGFLRPPEERCPPSTWPRKSPEGWKTGTPRTVTSTGSPVLGFRA